MNEVLYPAFGVLLVDDEAPWLRTLSMTLEGPGGITNLETCRDSREVMARLASRDFGLVLLDLTMPYLSGETLLGKIVEEYPGTAVIVVSGLNQVDTAVRCMRAGAFDYFVKGVDDDRLLDGVRRALRLVQLEREHRDMSRRFLDGRLEHAEVFADIVTIDPGMRAIFSYIESVAPSAQPVLLTGESGTGKELVARALHRLGRPQGPLVSLNAAGLDDNVFADTLFGHVRGAFTGADAPRRGMLEQAAGGTLFLDEIGDLSSSSQVKLLRLLQEGEYYPLGSDEPKQATARIVVATHQDLAARQSAGEFRKDLYYRLRGHHLHLPPLRERRGDIPLLLRHFLDEAARELGKAPPSFPPQLPVLLGTYAFPGNVRELRGMVFDAVSVHTSKVLSMSTFQRAMGRQDGAAEPVAAPARIGNPFVGVDPLPSLAEAVNLLIDEAMERSAGNQTIASRLVGISQPALSKRLKQSRD
ncbi:sigma-54-dependent transcriptional regulator [Trichloromonas sp.]|uniref:sigma-54-dependent transcriptional regulator n=1 Tax=Trichloromonas sp. TaxID=3069249 RepID=UPI003D8162C7